MCRAALRAGVGALIAGLAAAVAPAAAGAAPACDRPAVVPADEAALTAMINQARRAQGMPRVARHAALRKAGRRKSLQMAGGGAFSHEGAMSWARGRAAGQNLAMAPDARTAFRAMLASPEHRKNLLARAWRFTGVGAARGCDGVVYFTVNLMAPARG